MNVINITPETNFTLATAVLAQRILQEQPVQIQVRNAASVRAMLATIETAQEYLFAKGKSLIPLDGDLHIDGADDIYAAVRLMGIDKDEADDRPAAYLPMTEAELEAQVMEDFAERQDMIGEENKLVEKLLEHTADSPILSGGDLDAAWDDADVGEETVGGTTPTPDQDRVDLLGEAVGLTYEDDEPLHTAEKLAYRDHHRWELDPRSAADEQDESADE